MEQDKVMPDDDVVESNPISTTGAVVLLIGYITENKDQNYRLTFKQKTGSGFIEWTAEELLKKPLIDLLSMKKMIYKIKKGETKNETDK